MLKGMRMFEKTRYISPWREGLSLYYIGEYKLVKTIEVMYCFIQNETPPQLGGGEEG